MPAKERLGAPQDRAVSHEPDSKWHCLLAGSLMEKVMAASVRDNRDQRHGANQGNAANPLGKGKNGGD